MSIVSARLLLIRRVLSDGGEPRPYKIYYGFAFLWRARFIPLPPLPILEETVASLDRFEALVSDLKDGVPAEIAARRKQYEYYRNQLLSFTPLN